MKKRLFISSFIALTFLMSISTPVFAGDKLQTLLSKEYLTSSEIIWNADILDGLKITLRGEVVSEPLERDGYCWINVYDNQNNISIGVLANTDMIADIEYWGDYRTTGNTIDIRGTVYRADPEADGELDMHADSISVVYSSPAGERSITIPLWKYILSAVLFLGLLIILGERLLNYFKNRHGKNEHILERYMDE